MGGEWQFCDYDFGGQDYFGGAMEDHGREIPSTFNAGSPHGSYEADKAAPVVHKFESGAKSTVVKPRYDLIPQRADQLNAGRFAYGAERHGEGNYRVGKNDPKFITDRINHMHEHVKQFARFRRTSDLAAILCNASILAELEADTERDVDY